MGIVISMQFKNTDLMYKTESKENVGIIGQHKNILLVEEEKYMRHN